MCVAYCANAASNNKARFQEHQVVHLHTGPPHGRQSGRCVFPRDSLHVNLVPSPQIDFFTHIPLPPTLYIVWFLCAHLQTWNHEVLLI